MFRVVCKCRGSRFTRVALEEGVSTEALKLREESMTDRSKCGQETSTNSDHSRPKMVHLTACSRHIRSLLLSKLAITKVTLVEVQKHTHTHTHTHWWLNSSQRTRNWWEEKDTRKKKIKPWTSSRMARRSGVAAGKKCDMLCPRTEKRVIPPAEKFSISTP